MPLILAMAEIIDHSFYKSADSFFAENSLEGLTYDDVTLATQYSEVLPKQTNLDVSLSDALQLHIPIISADMDTVTEAKMAIAMAHNGGLGLIHYNMTEKAQVKEVARVKNHIHGLIQEPIKVSPDMTIGQVLEFCENKQFSFRTFPVVDEKGKLLGLLPGRVARPRYEGKLVKEAMTPRKGVLRFGKRIWGRILSKLPIAFLMSMLEFISCLWSMKKMCCEDYLHFQI